MTSRPKVVVLARLPAAGIELLGRLHRRGRGEPTEPGWLEEHAPGVGGARRRPEHPGRPTSSMEAVGTSLEVVSNFGVGYDNIDLDAARARGVRVTNTPGVLTNATAELAVALMLAAGTADRRGGCHGPPRRVEAIGAERTARPRAGRRDRRARGLRAYRPARRGAAPRLRGAAVVHVTLGRLRRRLAASAASSSTSWAPPTSSASTCHSPRRRGT